MHTQLDLRGNIPVFVRLTEASVHDVNVLDGINVEMGAIYLIDKGYVDFKRLYRDFQAKDAFSSLELRTTLSTRSLKQCLWKSIQESFQTRR